MEEKRRSVLSEIKNARPLSRLDPLQSKLMYHEEKDLGKYPDNQREDIVGLFQLCNSKFIPRRKNIFEGASAITNKVFYHSLGEAPHRLKCAESLLIFNTRVNPYKHYTTVDNIDAEEQLRVKKPRSDQQEIQLTDAPKALREGERLTTYAAEGYEYKPGYKELIPLNLPTGLSGLLTGIVELNVMVGESSVFAPSKEGLTK